MMPDRQDMKKDGLLQGGLSALNLDQRKKTKQNQKPRGSWLKQKNVSYDN